jgi:hypothetical protein
MAAAACAGGATGDDRDGQCKGEALRAFSSDSKRFVYRHRPRMLLAHPLHATITRGALRVADTVSNRGDRGVRHGVSLPRATEAEQADATAQTARRASRGPIGVWSARGEDMTLCPIALAVHCTGCPIVKVCPAKRALGDYATYVAPTTSESGAKPDGNATTPKADH